MSAKSAWPRRLTWVVPILVYAASLLFVFLNVSEEQGNETVIRFAHWNLHEGLREGYDELASHYEALNPGVKIEQTVVPKRVWYSWQQTQLVGGDPPDIIQLGRITEDEVIVQHFVPLGEFSKAPNPYNFSSPLEGIPWRDTFFDGLNSVRVYYPALQEIYGVPTMMMSLCMFYNEDLLKAITGSSKAPQNYRDYLILRDQIEAYRQRTGRTLLPIAGASDYGSYLIGNSFQRLTQKRRPQIDRPRVLTLPPSQVALAYLRGDWSLQDEEIQGALTVFQSLGQGMQPGFLHLKREDASLIFTQQKTVAMLSGSWDYFLFGQECDFPLVVGPLPLPDPADPVYGHFTNGRPHEGEGNMNGVFGITKTSRHQEQALDFLRYLTSHTASARFATSTHTLPATLKIDPTDQNLRVFARVEDGPVNGFNLGVGAESHRWLMTNSYRLFQPGGTAQNFVDDTTDTFRQALISDLNTVLQDQIKINQRTDTIITAALLRATPQHSKSAGLFSGQISRELEISQLQISLDKEAD